ncbi:MAG TPA: hypothetical protein VF525_16865 [Pyrinomonadaceae bacterium]
MRRLLIGGAMAGVLLVGLWAASAAPAPANFAGTWTLDKTKSKDLPQQWENVESYNLTITQDAQQLTVDTKVTRKENPDAQGGGPGGGGPGGGRRGGGMMGPQKMTYKLDGSEATLDTGGRGSATAKAEWQNGGKTLKLTTKRTFNFQGNDVTSTTTEVWDLSGDGKTLTIQRTSESPRGTMNTTLVFNKA